MKRIIAVCLSIMLIAALLCACGGSKNYKDGTYTGQSQIFKGDEEGNGDGYGVVTLTIKENTITADSSPDRFHPKILVVPKYTRNSSTIWGMILTLSR